MQKGLLSILVVVASIGLLSAQAPQPDPKNPQYQAKGDQKRTYSFPGTGESIPYHLYVPAKWDKNAKLPLVIVTHGAGQPAERPSSAATVPLANSQRSAGTSWPR